MINIYLSIYIGVINLSRSIYRRIYIQKYKPFQEYIYIYRYKPFQEYILYVCLIITTGLLSAWNLVNSSKLNKLTLLEIFQFPGKAGFRFLILTFQQLILLVCFNHRNEENEYCFETYIISFKCFVPTLKYLMIQVYSDICVKTTPYSTVNLYSNHSIRL